VKTFLLVAMLTVGSGLAVRFALHRHHEPAHATVEIPPAPRPTPPEPVTPPPEPPPPPPPVAPTPPAPPRIAGAKQISDALVKNFAAAAGVIYYCDGTSVMAQPKSGGDAQSVGDCDNAFDFIADAQGVFYCNQHTLNRITAGTQGSHVVADNVDCIMEALDAKYAYFAVPGFEGAVNPGVYRVVRAGGTPERIYSKSPTEQFSVAVDNEAVWIAAYGAGTISRLAKTPGAAAKELVSKQPGIVTFAIDPTYLYWHSENTTEVRRRKRTGGPIEVVGHQVSQEPVTTSDGHAYWFEGPPDDSKLVHLVPGALRVDTLASGLHTPSLRVDSEGAYVTELDQPGVFMFPR